MFEPEPVKYQRFVEETLKVCSPPFRTQNTLIKMRYTLESFRKIERPETVGDVTFEAVADYVIKRKKLVKTNTIRGELSYLSAAMSHAVERGWIDRNPCASRRLKLREEPARIDKAHSLVEIAKVLAYLDARKGLGWPEARLFALAHVLAYTGLRRNEALTLERRDVDLESGMIEVSGRTGFKTRDSVAPVPIAPPLRVALEFWLAINECQWVFPGNAKTSPWTSGALGARALDSLKDAGQACGVKRLTIASLRHDFATHAESAWGLSELTVQRILRHTSPRTQRRYRHADRVNLVNQVTRVDYSAEL